jgi:hypothetical protein
MLQRLGLNRLFNTSVVAANQSEAADNSRNLSSITNDANTAKYSAVPEKTTNPLKNGAVKMTKETKLAIDELVKSTNLKIAKRIEDTNQAEEPEQKSFVKKAFGVVKYGVTTPFSMAHAGMVKVSLAKDPETIPLDGCIATAIYKDENGVVRAFDYSADLLLQNMLKNGMAAPDIENGEQIPIIFEMYESGEQKTSFKEQIFQPIAKSAAVENTVVKGKKTKEYKDGKEYHPTDLEVYSTQESYIYTLAKTAMLKGSSGFGDNEKLVKISDDIVDIESPEPENIAEHKAFDFLASNTIRIHSNSSNSGNDEIAGNLELAVNSEANKEIRGKLSALKILSMASGEQIDIGELMLVLTLASGLGVLGEFAGDAIKHALEKAIGHGLGAQIAAGLIKGVAVGGADAAENGANGYAMLKAEIAKRGIDKITDELIFGPKFNTLSTMQKAHAYMLLATGKLEKLDLMDLKGEISSTMSNALYSALKGAGIAVAMTLVPLIILSRDYEKEGIIKFLAIQSICSTIAVKATGLSIPLELRNIIDRTRATLNHIFRADTIKDDSSTIDEKKAKVDIELQETITSSVANKSSLKAYAMVPTISLIWLLHEKVWSGKTTGETIAKGAEHLMKLIPQSAIDTLSVHAANITSSNLAEKVGQALASMSDSMPVALRATAEKAGEVAAHVAKKGLPDKAAKTLFIALLAPFENLWRGAFLAGDMPKLKKKIAGLGESILSAELKGEALPDGIVGKELSDPLTKKVLFPQMNIGTTWVSNVKNTVSLVASNFKYAIIHPSFAFGINQPRNRIMYDADSSIQSLTDDLVASNDESNAVIKEAKKVIADNKGSKQLIASANEHIKEAEAKLKIA